MWYFPFSEIFCSAAFAALLLKNHPRNADDLGATGLSVLRDPECAVSTQTVVTVVTRMIHARYLDLIK